jgi:peroxiredoxin
MLQVGQRAPDFALEQLNGGRVCLKDLLAPHTSLLIVFLRHLG